jgi:eukaryotic-like serine/threonine-protein kinase
MGEVYRARDTRLKRDVALKVLPDAFALDPSRMARFQREAEVLASLNHPNVAAIYGVEERALVMELVEGESPKGPMPFDEAWKIALQMADALEYAHEKGVVHRDLKPANIKVTHEGVVKLLDFGLAKAFGDPSESGAADPADSPTTIGTTAGTILGTAAYMAPEQARGKRVDRRADIWAWGVVLYELITGERLFKGEDASITLAQVLTKEPDLTRVPANARRVLQECLQKDPKLRLRDIGDAKRLLGEPTAPIRGGRVAFVPWIIASVAIAAALALAFLHFRQPAESPRTLNMSVLPPGGGTFPVFGIPSVSPDGRHLAFAATVDGIDRLWLRDLDSQSTRALAGTEGGNLPFWSPDSRFIGFFGNGRLRKIDTAGGPPVILCDAPDGRGGSWSKDDVIVFAPGRNTGLSRVPAAGGTATVLTALNTSLSEQAHRFPWFLPDGRHFLFTIRSTIPDQTAVYVGDLEAPNDPKSRPKLATASSNAVFAAPGYLLYLRERTLMAQPFDTTATRTTGEAVALVEGVDYTPIDIRGQFSASQNGELVYLSSAFAGSRLTWFDRSGKVLGRLGEPGLLQWPAISPDGATVAVDRRDSQSGLPDLWLHDIARDTSSRLTNNSQSEFPVWAPDGRSIAFQSLRPGRGNVSRKEVTNGGPIEDFAKGMPNGRPVDWSRDGRYLVEQTEDDPKTRADLWIVPLFGDRKPFPYLQTESNEHHARLSPNGNWLVYVSDETGRNEIYVQSFPMPGKRWRVSTNGGTFPVWSRDGKELFYFGADRRMMAVEVNAGSDFEPGVSKSRFETRLGCCDIWFDVTKDGRFLIPTLTGQAGNVPLTVVVNWPAGLKK